MSDGLFITFEGLDKVGKSTQVDKLQEYLKTKKREFVFVREPGSTEVSEKIRELLADRDLLGKIAPLTEFLLYSASRTQLIIDKIKPALADGKIVISDRFFDSSTAYQGYGRGLDIAFIQQLNLSVTDNIKPDLTILLKFQSSTVNNKAAANRMNPDLFDDRLEKEFLEFRDKVQDGFLEIAENDKERFLILDASQTKAKIASAIAARVESLLKRESS